MQSQNKPSKRMTIILFVGCLLRLFYIIGSTVFDRQYDIGTIAIDQGHTVSGGHLAYIQYFYENWHLPDFDPTLVYQFNHPPMHHYLSALILKICSFFIHDTACLYETLQVVPFVCSILILWFSYRIYQKIITDQKALEFCMILTAFHPALILLSGSVNNDTMSLLFMILCVHTMMEWCEKKTVANIVKAALSIALGMMTKQSVAIMAFPMGIVFLVEWIKNWKTEKTKLLVQYIVFGVVSVPLGMWFYIRNMILYKMPLVWVYTLPEDSWQYTGNIPVLNRFLWPVPSDLIHNLTHFQMGCGYNIWMQIIRTAIVGEWDMSGVGKGIKVVAMLLMLTAAVLAFAAFVGFIKVLFVSKMGKNEYGITTPVWILFVVGYIVNFLFYIKFAYDYPQECSMNFRYIEIELLFMIGALGLWKSKSTNKVLNTAINGLTGVYCLLSTVLVCVWCFTA